MGSDYYTPLQDRAMTKSSINKIKKDIARICKEKGLCKYNYFMGTGNSGVAVASMLFSHIPYSGWGFYRKDTDACHHGMPDHNDYDFLRRTIANIWLVDDFISSGKTMAFLAHAVACKMDMQVAGFITMSSSGRTKRYVLDDVAYRVRLNSLVTPEWTTGKPLFITGRNRIRQ